MYVEGTHKQFLYDLLMITKIPFPGEISEHLNTF